MKLGHIVFVTTLCHFCFVVLSELCWGHWNVPFLLLNEVAVEYVRERIDTKTPTTEIGREMLDQIISVDPRVTQGIGGETMTIMNIDLQPHGRSWRKKCSAQALDTVTKTFTTSPTTSSSTPA
jgi:hypothetical protein